MSYENEKKELIKILESIRNESEFVDGILDLLENEEDLDTMYKWIKDRPKVTEPEVIKMALDLNIPRTEPERVIKD
ncbi:hypothetical protein [Coprobacillus sp. AF33-1AC]|uniref:hypothetical protein n=1 Tax=Coprobacillus sp. AF33-1AC TaxID=2292032 RepID=UPI000E4C3027|nr:hypothetical protein [Coprobacillus sp. AF33-1AC]RHM59662.1 hypothetical protein DWZ53_08950 [Coprobacillus sp. AF33-1AC]